MLRLSSLSHLIVGLTDQRRTALATAYVFGHGLRSREESYQTSADINCGAC